MSTQSPATTVAGLDITAIEKLSISQARRRDKQTPICTEAEEAEKRSQISHILRNKFLNKPKSNIKSNFFRILTHDQCNQRHYCLEPKVLDLTCPLNNGRHDAEQDIILADTSPLGSLDKLPLEIRQQILSETTLSALTTCRCVSRGFCHAIGNLPQYKDVMTFAPCSLRAALSIEVAPHITCIDLHNVLCRKECNACGKFGAFLYLLRCERVCYECVKDNDDYLPLKPTHAMQKTATKPKDFRIYPVPTARCLPGQYDRSNYRKREAHRIQLVDMNSAIVVGSKVHGSADRAKELAESRQYERSIKWDEQMDDWYEWGFGRAPRRPPFYDYEDGHQNNPHRFMCIVGFPWLDRSQKSIEWGIACNGCHRLPKPRPSPPHYLLFGQDQIAFDAVMKKTRTLYSEEEYIKHFTLCQPSLEKLAAEKDKLFGPAILCDPLDICNVAGDKTSVDPAFFGEDGRLLPQYWTRWRNCRGAPSVFDITMA